MTSATVLARGGSDANPRRAETRDGYGMPRSDLFHLSAPAVIESEIDDLRKGYIHSQYSFRQDRALSLDPRGPRGLPHEEIMIDLDHIANIVPERLHAREFPSLGWRD